MELKNFGFINKAGMVMAVSSLPGPYGIGALGKEAFRFVDFLRESGIQCWQVLPLNPTSYGDSPYQSPASVAGNPYFIDLDILAQKGLLTDAELETQRCDAPRVDYGWLFHARYAALRTAFSRFTPDKEYYAFLAENTRWIEDYALFMALKVHYNYAQWTGWEENHRSYEKAKLCKEEFRQEMAFWQWVQFEFSAQWQAVREYAHQKGILIIGDMPIYVAHDSMDVWAAPEQFLLDENYIPTVVAGCPPDGFTPDGQLWGNPIYNWEKMEEEGFAWWLRRAGDAFRLYDILRIDHFRGFAGYYNIPYGEETAKNGKWDAAPGIALFRKMAREYPQAKIIAEDLGFITPDVVELLEDAGFPGMKMPHFGFYDEDSVDHPANYKKANSVAYVSSHDSDCTKSWLEGLDAEAAQRLDAACPHYPGRSRVYDVITMVLKTPCNLVMIPLQDFLELSNEEGRMNVPSTAAGNWNWRATGDFDKNDLSQAIRMLLLETGRI